MNIINNSFYYVSTSDLNKEFNFDCKENQPKDISAYFLSKQKKIMSGINQVQYYLTSRKLEPVSTGNDTNGSYFLFLLNESDHPKKHGVYKPSSQSRGAIDRPMETQTRKGIPPGSQSFRERLAYALQEELINQIVNLNIPFSKLLIPMTVLAEIKHDSFGENHQIGSYQRYKGGRSPLGEASEKELNAVPVEEFLILTLIDCFFLNTDRHLNNILCAIEGKPRSSILTLIDHGECFPEVSSLDEISLEWRYLPFAKNPFPPSWAELINQLNIRKLVERILSELDEMKFQEKGKLGISGEAIAIFIYAVVNLQYFVHTFPKESISQYVEHLSKHSQFCAEIRDSKAQNDKRIIRLDALTHQSAKEEFRNKYGEIEETEIRRKDFGGQFVKSCKDYWQNAKKTLFKGKQPSPKQVFESLDHLKAMAEEQVKKK
jgi:hypothetical protein